MSNDVDDFILKLKPCEKTPLSLYELAANAVDSLEYPEAFNWSVEEVARWMVEDVGLPQYQECVRDNGIDGMRLLMLEDASKLPDINIHYFHHIQLITKMVGRLFGTEIVRFARSIGLPPRKPLTHCTWFKSGTGPSWGIKRNWDRCDVLRWMKIIMPAPIYIDHWDLIWYQKPDFPKVMFARIPKPNSQVHIPHCKTTKDLCNEYLVPRKFRLQTGIRKSAQLIWTEQRPGYKKSKEKTKEEKVEKRIPSLKKKVLSWKELQKNLSFTELTGKDLVLARRKMAKTKFMP